MLWTKCKLFSASISPSNVLPYKCGANDAGFLYGTTANQQYKNSAIWLLWNGKLFRWLFSHTSIPFCNEPLFNCNAPLPRCQVDRKKIAFHTRSLINMLYERWILLQRNLAKWQFLQLCPVPDFYYNICDLSTIGWPSKERLVNNLHNAMCNVCLYGNVHCTLVQVYYTNVLDQIYLNRSSWYIS